MYIIDSKGMIYVFGGWNTDSEPVTPQLVVLDPKTWNWTIPNVQPGGHQPPALAGHCANTVDDQMIITFGNNMKLSKFVQLSI